MRILDPRLTAYWDVFSCGPAGDDHNVDWCGGFVKEPHCPDLVNVDASLCASGVAELVANKSGSEGAGTVMLEGCLFIYIAQYHCLPLTTTTTTTTTVTTTTRTTTSSTTSSTTSTVTTTTTTTVTHTTTTTSTTTRACHHGFQPPPAPLHATDLNGVRLPDNCMAKEGPHRVFILGDWGGLLGPLGPKPARQRAKKMLVAGIDDRPQQRVAEQMRARAAANRPDYVINVGDSFYWAGLDTTCGAPAYKIISTGQLERNFEQVYNGPGLDGVPWLGILGNHDYGGYLFNKGWDQLISYTWKPGGRWLMPAQYWRSTVRYPDFSVDYFFLDTNVFDAEEPHADPEHNICSLENNPTNASCGAEGPTSVWDCPKWFRRLWEAEKAWLEGGLRGSASTWQVIVTHFPPTWGRYFWTDLAERHGIDLFISGHVHRQAIHGPEDADNFLRPTPWLVSGGGGGITSEDLPHADGKDDQYGFMELTLSREAIEVKAISHGGQLRRSVTVHPRHRPHTEQEGDDDDMVFKRLQ